MTLVGLEYLQHQETKRANRANEALKDKDINVRAETADKDRSSKEMIADKDRASREHVSSLDRLSRETIATLDRASREDIATKDRASKESMNIYSEMNKYKIAEEDRVSRANIAHLDRQQADRKLQVESQDRAKQLKNTFDIAVLGANTNRYIADENRKSNEKIASEKNSNATTNTIISTVGHIAGPLVSKLIPGFG